MTDQMATPEAEKTEEKILASPNDPKPSKKEKGKKEKKSDQDAPVVETKSEETPDRPKEIEGIPVEVLEDDGKRLPGEKGYAQMDATRRIRRRIRAAEEIIAAERELLNQVQQYAAQLKPGVDRRLAIQASQQLGRKLKQQEMDKRIQVMKTLREMGIIPQ